MGKEAGATMERELRKRGCREGRDVLQAGELGRGSTWGALALRCHLTNLQENPNHLLLPRELEFCVSGMQKHRDTQERASGQSEKDLLFGPLTCGQHDKPVKPREGSSGGVREAPCSESQ